MGWCWRLGGIPQETPANQEKKQKTVSYKMPAPGSLPSPNANHFLNLCLIKWLVWNYPHLDTYPHSPGNAPLFFPSPRSFGSTQSSRRFLPILPQHSLTMFFLTFWSMFFALPEMKPKQCYKMTVPTSYCKKQALLQNDSPSKKTRLLQNDMVQWAQVVTKCHFFLNKNASETRTWDLPFHNGNVHRDQNVWL